MASNRQTPPKSGNHVLRRDIRRVLISAARIQRRTRQLAAQIGRDYAGQDLTLVSILKGSVVFLSDLIRFLPMKCSVDFMAVSSYGGATESSGVVRLVMDLRESPEGKNLLLVEDLVDTGLTLEYILRNLRTRGPRSVRVCALLDKPANRKVPVQIDYTGFRIPNEFVVGYGMDYQERYRNLPYVGVLKTG